MSPKIAAEWMGGTQLAQFFNVSSMTIWRWERDDKLKFPKPTIINSRKYWSREALDKWMRERATRPIVQSEKKSPREARRQMAEA